MGPETKIETLLAGKEKNGGKTRKKQYGSVLNMNRVEQYKEASSQQPIFLS